MGELFERPDAGQTKGYTKKECIYQVKSVNNTKSKIQVAAFGSLYKAKRRGGMDKWNAFAEAIVNTSDEVFAEAKLKSPGMIKQWKKQAKHKVK
jgi:hypothetical protein